MESWTYWKNPIKHEKHSHSSYTIKINNIITGPSEIIVAYTCDPPSKEWKTGYAIMTGPTEKLLEDKRSNCISGPQLKIKNQIMAYWWTSGKDPLKLQKILWTIQN